MKSFKTIIESRPTRIFDIISAISKCKDFDLIDSKGTFSGFVSLFRYKGNAYEISIKPAEKSTEFVHYTK